MALIYPEHSIFISNDKLSRSRLSTLDYFEKRGSVKAQIESSLISSLESDSSDKSKSTVPAPVIRSRLIRRGNGGNQCANEYTGDNFRSLVRRKPSILSSRCQLQNKLGNLKNRKGILSTVEEEMPPKTDDEVAQRRAVVHLSKHLRCHCDKFLDSSIPFAIDTSLLKTVSKAINSVLSKDPNIGKENAEELKYQDFVMFLSDFFDQTPSLCLAVPSTPGIIPPSISVDLQYFRNLQFLEIRKISPHLVRGWSSVKPSLKRLKCSRCLVSVGEILAPHSSRKANPGTTPEERSGKDSAQTSINLTVVWPELKEVDFSYNHISDITNTFDTFAMTPTIEILNLSRNKINSIDDSFTKVMTCLSVLNLNYNKLTIIPPLPPNLKVLLLAHNYITKLTVPSQSFSIGTLRALEMLDLSANMISSKDDLSVLRQLSCLTNIALMGNPISYLVNYRSTVCCYLSRLVLKKTFTLDRKRLSNSEIRLALEALKKLKFVPFIPAVALGPSLPSSFSTGTSSNASNRFNQLKSLTESYESNSSSLRSSCRKKPKIREIILDTDDDDNVNSGDKNADDGIEVVVSPVPKDDGQYSSGSSSPSEKSEIMVLETKAIIASMRETYGPEYWLLKQAGDKMKKLLKIPDRPVNPDLLYSSSLPRANTSTHFDNLSDKNFRLDDDDKLTDAELLILSSGRSHSVTVENPLHSTNQTDSTAKESFLESSGAENRAAETDSSIFYSCNSTQVYSHIEKNEGNESEQTSNTTFCQAEDKSIFDFENEADTPEVFSDEQGYSEQFRIFQSGICFTLAIMNNYLYEFDPEDNIILTKWDLKSLQSLQEDHCDSDTETVEFTLNFDLIKKQLREKSFIMSAKDFSKFDKLVSPYIEEKAMLEFADAMQCFKCKAQFSRGMANKIVKQEKGQAPKEIQVCPNPDCESEFLIPLDEIPLPNNGVLSVEGAEFVLNGPLRSSTPVSGNLMSVSIPKHSGRSARHVETKTHASSLTFKVTHSKSNNHSNSDSIETVPRPTTASSSEKSSITVLNTRSDSDIEVLSCDSSSIEVLAKHSADSGSDVEVQDAEEAEEVEVIDYASKSVKSVVMTESTSSGSYADSICTTYERKLMGNMQSLSQQLANPLPPTLSSPSSSTSFSSLTSTSTLTTYSYNSPGRTAAVPIRYDYNDFKVDHRLQLFCELVVFKAADEKLILLTKVLTITDSAPFLCIVIISNKKIYFYKIVGAEGEKPQDWLQKLTNFDVSKMLKLDVLIGRHGVGLELSSKYYALLFRDSQRTVNFIKHFMGICEVIDFCPMVRDFSQTQKVLMSPKNPVSYFGILRFAVCDNDKSYAVSAIVLTDEELMLLSDLGWLAVRCESVTAKHSRYLSCLRQVESLESDPTFLRIIIDAENYVVWELYFETDEEKDIFTAILKTQLKNVPFISLSQPIEP